MATIKNLMGQTFGRLTALRIAGKYKDGGMVWLCRCSCDGKETEVRSTLLVLGTTTSCGCARRELARACMVDRWRNPQFKPGLKHGHRASLIYRSWRCVLNRCTNPHTPGWMKYGGANPPVKVCDRWLNSFEAFLEDMGERPAGTTLGRFGDVGNYEPGNCAWQTPKEQGAERRIKNQLKFLAA